MEHLLPIEQLIKNSEIHRMIKKNDLLLIFFLSTLFSYAQVINLSFEYPVIVQPGAIDYFVEVSYFDHHELETKKVYAFLDKRQSATIEFNQPFPVEATLKLQFDGVNEELPLLLNPKNTLHLHINQQIRRTGRAEPSKAYWKERYQLKGKDAEVNQLMIRYKNEVLKDDYDGYSSFRNRINATSDKEALRNEFNELVNKKIKQNSDRIDNLPITTTKGAKAFINYLKDLDLLKLGKNTMHYLNYNGYQFGIDREYYNSMANRFMKLQKSNTHLKKAYYLSNTISLYGSGIDNIQNNVYRVPFNHYMQSAYFVMGEEWKDDYMTAVEKGNKPLNTAQTLLSEYRTNGDRKYISMLNDIYFNGVMYGAFLKDSLFVNELKKSTLSSNVKLQLLLYRLMNPDDSGLRGIGSHLPDYPIRTPYLSKKHEQLFRDAFSEFAKDDYSHALATVINKRDEVLKIPYKNNSVKKLEHIENDADAFKHALPQKAPYSVVFIIEQKSEKHIAKYTAIMNHLKSELGDDVEFVVYINWGKREHESLVELVYTAIENARLKESVRCYIADYNLGLYQYDESNLRLPWHILVMNKEGFLPEVAPKTNGYFSYKRNERALLNYGEALQKTAPENTPPKYIEIIDDDMDIEEVYVDEMPQEQHQKPDETLKEEEKLLDTFEEVLYKENTSVPLPLTGSIIQLINKNKNVDYERFKKFINHAFNAGEGWFVIENKNTLILSKNKFRLVTSTKPVIWIKEPGSKNLHVYNSESREALNTHKINIATEDRTLSILKGGLVSQYQILFYDEEIILLYPLDNSGD